MKLHLLIKESIEAIKEKLYEPAAPSMISCVSDMEGGVRKGHVAFGPPKVN